MVLMISVLHCTFTTKEYFIFFAVVVKLSVLVGAAHYLSNEHLEDVDDRLRRWKVICAIVLEPLLVKRTGKVETLRRYELLAAKLAQAVSTGQVFGTVVP